MAIAKIAAPLSGSRRDAVVLATAFALAKPSRAYVDAVFIHPDPREAIPVSDLPIAPEIVQELVDAAEIARKAAAKAARQALSTAAAHWGIKIISVPERMETATATWREITGHPEDMLNDIAKLADLVVFPPMAADDPDMMHRAFVHVLTRTGRPVVLCADKVPAKVGSIVGVAWDGGATAAHALTAAISILEEAASVELICVRPDSDARVSIEEAKQYLALHGIKAKDTRIETKTRKIGNELLETARAKGYDLLVMGGYGHSRLIESVFGGTTEFLASHPEIPILMVH